MSEQEKAAAAYKAGAAQRDPQAVKNADATAAEHGSQAAGADRGPR
ncbi:hypothetical protein VSR01_17365 [Actinacidiphila sp. DG2A-62]|nr:hypothetical protein [Actinacidiphila sp. DG2A-62]MEC3995208.1 hypothetical protein [Actinacidiphila sp. DG2A-62]